MENVGGQPKLRSETILENAAKRQADGESNSRAAHTHTREGLPKEGNWQEEEARQELGPPRCIIGMSETDRLKK